MIKSFEKKKKIIPKKKKNIYFMHRKVKRSKAKYSDCITHKISRTNDKQIYRRHVGTPTTQVKHTTTTASMFLTFTKILLTKNFDCTVHSACDYSCQSYYNRPKLWCRSDVIVLDDVSLHGLTTLFAGSGWRTLRGSGITWTGSDSARNRSTGRGSSRLNGRRRERRSGNERREKEWSAHARTTTDDGLLDKAGTVRRWSAFSSSLILLTLCCVFSRLIAHVSRFTCD